MRKSLSLQLNPFAKSIHSGKNSPIAISSHVSHPMSYISFIKVFSRIIWSAGSQRPVVKVARMKLTVTFGPWLGIWAFDVLQKVNHLSCNGQAPSIRIWRRSSSVSWQGKLTMFSWYKLFGLLSTSSTWPTLSPTTLNPFPNYMMLGTHSITTRTSLSD